MKIEEVPQDNCGSVHKAMYAVDDNGSYTLVESSGWQAEKAATRVAIVTFENEAAAAYARCRVGESSTLEYHMLACRMDATTLAESTGIARWRVRRHLRQEKFDRLPNYLLARYAQALQMPITALSELPAALPK